MKVFHMFETGDGSVSTIIDHRNDMNETTALRDERQGRMAWPILNTILAINMSY